MRMKRLSPGQIGHAVRTREQISDAAERRALKELCDKDQEDKLKKYANVPASAIPKSNFVSQTSNGLTACILRWLHLHGHYGVRVTTTGRQLKGSSVVDVIGRARTFAGQWIPGTTRPGTADVHAAILGKHCSIEVKVGQDRMSEAQERTRQDVEDAGGSYFIAKTFADFLIWYREIVGSSR